jgi:hypothetical protein
MCARMLLDIWKCWFPWPLRIFSMSVGNNFQQPRENRGMRHFQCPAHPPPTGDGLRWTSPAAQAVGASCRGWRRRDPERTTSRCSKRGARWSGVWFEDYGQVIVQFGDKRVRCRRDDRDAAPSYPTAKGTGPITRPARLAAERQAQSLGVCLHLAW